MKTDYAEVRRLLRLGLSGALGSNSLAVPGHPFVSLLSYVLDEACRPVFLLSGLAEHTKNLLADPRASLLVAEAPGGGLEQARVTVLGTVARVESDALWRARFLRYSPESRDYLEWADFAFFRLEPVKARFIGGFGRMGWVDAVAAPSVLEPRIEAEVLEALTPDLPPGARVEGLDPEGLDLVVLGVRRRIVIHPEGGGRDALLAAAREGIARAGLGETTDPIGGNLA